MDEPRKCFLETESTPGGDILQFVEMTVQNLYYYINLVDKAGSGFERIGSKFQRSSTVGEMLLNSITYYRKIVCEREN